jgi:hypothetical protein
LFVTRKKRARGDPPAPGDRRKHLITLAAGLPPGLNVRGWIARVLVHLQFFVGRFLRSLPDGETSDRRNVGRKPTFETSLVSTELVDECRRHGRSHLVAV